MANKIKVKQFLMKNNFESFLIKYFTCSFVLYFKESNVDDIFFKRSTYKFSIYMYILTLGLYNFQSCFCLYGIEVNWYRSIDRHQILLK